ncbi:MAG: hypothetical protein AW07_02058 [Candidatus Accumulibacter sp. SK-11]|nr:MAG: hypothetical protein AW07_02058 [Candidatus Accumulibacter sp. SK-11]
MSPAGGVAVAVAVAARWAREEVAPTASDADARRAVARRRPATSAQDGERAAPAPQRQATPWLLLRRSGSTFDSQISLSGKQNPDRATCGPGPRSPPQNNAFTGARDACNHHATVPAACPRPLCEHRQGFSRAGRGTDSPRLQGSGRRHAGAPSAALSVLSRLGFTIDDASPFCQAGFAFRAHAPAPKVPACG